ncbi:MAG: hypothetical protein LUG93_15325 [Lachnospiraceae bacterium]|nr:hypothetical protein [Lachnospiraceae bacterium]
MDENNSSNQEQKMWNGNKHAVRVEISISGKRKEIHIGKDVVRLLGAPTYLCLKVNKAMDSIAVMPCPGKEYMSFKVPEGILLGKHVSMRVVSSSFVERILAVNGYRDNRTYQITGTYFEKNNAVVFNLADMRLFGEE